MYSIHICIYGLMRGWGPTERAPSLYSLWFGRLVAKEQYVTLIVIDIVDTIGCLLFDIGSGAYVPGPPLRCRVL